MDSSDYHCIISIYAHIAKYTWHFSNLVHSMRLNTFTKIDLHKWINNPFYIDENDDEKPPGGILLSQ